MSPYQFATIIGPILGILVFFIVYILWRLHVRRHGRRVKIWHVAVQVLLVILLGFAIVFAIFVNAYLRLEPDFEPRCVSGPNTGCIL